MKPDFAFACTLFGYEENYTREKAVALYGSYTGYMKKFQESLNQCIEKGLILEEEWNRDIYASCESKRRFL